ncbi:hypothetical protein [Ileibacterium valens]|uniref:hypothetical protein n=1 Tax=Ileibacterium valens TaxID=1862668 RepID=UPI00259B3169|nr:hypothetical protein [Ileibacterium valens]
MKHSKLKFLSIAATVLSLSLSNLTTVRANEEETESDPQTTEIVESPQTSETDTGESTTEVTETPVVSNAPIIQAVQPDGSLSPITGTIDFSAVESVTLQTDPSDSIQWQVSSDQINWIDIPQANANVLVVSNQSLKDFVGESSAAAIRVAATDSTSNQFSEAAVFNLNVENSESSSAPITDENNVEETFSKELELPEAKVKLSWSKKAGLDGAQPYFKKIEEDVYNQKIEAAIKNSETAKEAVNFEVGFEKDSGEIEPQQDVTVEFSIKKEVLKSEDEADQVELIHLDKEENGNLVKTNVATVENGTIAQNESEYSSTFTINSSATISARLNKDLKFAVFPYVLLPGLNMDDTDHPENWYGLGDSETYSNPNANGIYTQKNSSYTYVAKTNLNRNENQTKILLKTGDVGINGKVVQLQNKTPLFPSIEVDNKTYTYSAKDGIQDTYTISWVRLTPSNGTTAYSNAIRDKNPAISDKSPTWHLDGWLNLWDEDHINVNFIAQDPTKNTFTEIENSRSHPVKGISEKVLSTDASRIEDTITKEFITGDGRVYRFSGWYAGEYKTIDDSDIHDAGKSATSSPNNKVYFSQSDKILNGSVSYYAHYEEVTGSIEITKKFDGDLNQDTVFMFQVSNESTGTNVTIPIVIKKGMQSATVTVENLPLNKTLYTVEELMDWHKNDFAISNGTNSKTVQINKDNGKASVEFTNKSSPSQWFHNTMVKRNTFTNGSEGTQ